MRALSLLVLCLVLPVAAAASTPVPVTTCGQVLTGDGFLTGDLDCSAQPAGDATVTLSKTGRLNLGGFTLTGSPNVVDTVRCEDRCIINGLGGSSLGTIAGGQHAIASRSGKSGRVDVFYTNVTGADFGIVAPKVHARQLHVTGNAFEGIRADKVKLIDCTVTDNGGVGAGIRADLVNLIAAVVTGNGLAGVEGDKLHAQDSNVTGNGTDPSCGVTSVCVDLALLRRPHLKNTPCGTSLDRRACGCSVEDAPGPGTDPATHNFGACASD
jgi:hypothetical protein